jgi:hypothetical protein
MFPGLCGRQPCNSRNTWMQKYGFPELHSIFPELHGLQPYHSKFTPRLHGHQPCSSGNTRMHENKFPELHSVFLDLHEWRPCNSNITYLQIIRKTCFQDYTVVRHVIRKIYECKKMYFRNYMVYFWNYMIDDHVIPTLHECKLFMKDVRITWLPSMYFQKYIWHMNAFLELHGVFLKWHGWQKTRSCNSGITWCNSGNTWMSKTM